MRARWHHGCAAARAPRSQDWDRASHSSSRPFPWHRTGPGRGDFLHPRHDAAMQETSRDAFKPIDCPGPARRQGNQSIVACTRSPGSSRSRPSRCGRRHDMNGPNPTRPAGRGPANCRAISITWAASAQFVRIPSASPGPIAKTVGTRRSFSVPGRGSATIPVAWPLVTKPDTDGEDIHGTGAVLSTARPASSTTTREDDRTFISACRLRGTERAGDRGGACCVVSVPELQKTSRVAHLGDGAGVGSALGLVR